MNANYVLTQDDIEKLGEEHNQADVLFEAS
jgi:hypothetical protein